MNAEIISIGTEITTGSILNTNVQYLSEKLLELGVETLYHTSVDDDINRLKDVIKIALNRVDFIITTGGLGPTEDDLTKEVFSEALGLKLINDSTMVKVIEDKFKSYNKTQTIPSKLMPSNNLKQAIKLEGSQFLKNHVGTAPGIFLSKDNKKVVMLPGPPKEMKAMFDYEVQPLIHEDFYIVTRSINLSGIGESSVEMQLKDLLNKKDNISIATFAKIGEVEIKIIGRGKDKKLLEKDVKNMVKLLENRFNKNIYGLDNIPIEVIVFEMLKENNFKIGFCESCTGGLISGKFSRIPGASQVLDRSIVTYSNKAKVEEVQVNIETLNKFGAVSKEVALEMATGMLSHGDLDIALSITGIAGPSSDSSEKPVGLVYICVATKKSFNITELNLNGDRESIQDKATIRAFLEIKNYLLNYLIKD